MRWRAACVVLVLLACGHAEPPRHVDAGRMGSVALFPPRDGNEALVFLFSDSGGWNAHYAETARELTARGAAVVGVDLPSYLAGLVATHEDACHYTVAELEDWSHRFQRELGFERYRSPILAGVGAGATLAHAALAQSPAATVAGAVGVDPAEVLATHVPLCSGAPSRPLNGGFAYAPAEPLPGFWREPAAGPAPALARLANEVRDAIDAQAAVRDAELADLPQ